MAARSANCGCKACRCGYTRASALAGVEDCNPDAYEFRAPAQDAANFDLVDDGDEPTPFVDSGGDPTITMSLGHVAKMDAVVAKRHSVNVAPIGGFASELDRLAWSDLLIDIAAAIDPFGRFAPELRYPTWIRSHAALLEQCQRVCPPLPLPGFGRHGPRTDQQRMDCRQRDERPSHKCASDTVKVPAHHRAPLEIGNCSGCQSSQQRRPNRRADQQPRDDNVFVHGTTPCPGAQ